MEKDPSARWKDEYVALRGDLINLSLGRHVFQRINAAIAGNPALQPDDPVFEFVDRWYAQSTALAVRRQVRPNAQSVSLIRLLTQVLDRPEPLRADPGEIQSLIDRLKAAAASIPEYVDRAVAHLDKRPLTKKATVGDLNAALDELEHVFAACERLFLDREPFNPEVALPSGWANALTVAWQS